MMEETIFLERREKEDGRISVKQLGRPITQTVLDLLAFRVKTGTERRYFYVDLEEYRENGMEIEQLLREKALDEIELDNFGVKEFLG